MRGMKKWLPFKSLKGQYEELEKMKKERAKVEKPVLSEDEEEEVNRFLIGLKRGEKTKVTFYMDHELMTKEAVFVKIEKEQERIVFYGFSIPLNNLVKITYSWTESDFAGHLL
mgnify:CR=1 FL=1